MFNKGQIAGLMKQAQAMQDNLKKAQEDLANIEVEGESGAGLVKVVMTCKHDVKRITIDPSKTTETWNKATLEGQAEELAMEISEARQDLMNQGIQALQAQSQAIQELLPKADEIPNAN